MNEEYLTQRRKRRGRKSRTPARYVRFVLAAFLVIVITAATIAIVRDKASEVLVKPSSISLRLNGPFGPKYAGEIIAARANLFEQNGINIEIRESSEGLDPIAAVVSGAETFGVTDSISFFSAQAEGQPITAFAAGLIENSVVFYALAKSGIRTPQDFIGKRVGRRAGTNSAIIYDALLKKLGLSRSQIRETAADAGLNGLLDDKVDVIPGRIGREGFLLSQKGIPFNMVRISDYGIHIPDTVYFTATKLLKERPSMVQGILQSIIAGWTMAYTDPAKSIPLLVAAGKGLTTEQVQFELAAQRDFVMPVSRRIAEFDGQQWKQLRAILTSARLLDDSLDVGRSINYEMLKEVYRKPISFGN